MSVYPNPNNGIFTLALQNGESAGLEIYNSLGQLVLSQTVYPGLSEIDLGNYPAGVFHISLESSKGRSVYKVITSMK